MDAYFLFALAMLFSVFVGIAAGFGLVLLVAARAVEHAQGVPAGIKPAGAELEVPFSPGAPIIGHAQGRPDDNQMATEPLGGAPGPSRHRLEPFSTVPAPAVYCAPCAKIRILAKKIFPGRQKNRRGDAGTHRHQG